MTIATIEGLRQHLQWAIQLEHCTLPPYLCALYSIKPGNNEESARAIQSVFVEEMLHMVLAANLLNAVGGTPAIDRPDFIPRYPAYLPHSADAFLVPLARFAPETIETFMRIERPETTDAPAEQDRYNTIGQFNQAIEQGITALCSSLGETNVFTGDPAPPDHNPELQVRRKWNYHPSVCTISHLRSKQSMRSKSRARA